MAEFGFMSKEFVEQVRSSADIVKIVSQYVSLKRKGDRFWGCCPFHQEKTPSFSVKPDGGFFYCFGCHVGGNVFKFVSLQENVKYFEAVAMVAEQLNIPLPQKERTPEELARDKLKDELYQVNEMAGKFFHNCLTMTRYGQPGLEYFHSRGITDEIIQEFSLGFAPDEWDKLSVAFQKRGISEEMLLNSDLVRKRQQGQGIYDRFRNRVMIPITDERGRAVGFGGRIIGTKQENQAKYLNSAETILFNKRRLLFGLDKAHRHIAKAGFALVVEGYMDVISVYAAGIRNVVASLGTAFTIEQCRKLLRYSPQIYFCYDSDAAGQNAIMKAIEVTRGLDNAVVKVVQMPDCKDPDEFIQKHGAEEFSKVIEAAIPMVEFQLQYIVRGMDINSLEGRLQAMTRILPILASLKNSAQRNAYVARAAQLLSVSEADLQAELRRRGHSYHDDGGNPQLRRVVRQVDDAYRRAGRVVLKKLWEHQEKITEFLASVPLASIEDENQRKLFQMLEEKQKQGEILTDVDVANSLAEGAVDELSRALVESFGQQEETALYDDCVKRLRKRYLQVEFDRHRLEADRLSREGQKGFIEEMAIMQKLQNEMDELQSV